MGYLSSTHSTCQPTGPPTLDYHKESHVLPGSPPSRSLVDYSMKIAVIGTGYVGLVTGTCFADSGNDVSCVDIDNEKIARLIRGEFPIFEPGREEIGHDNQVAERLRITTDLSPATATPD